MPRQTPPAELVLWDELHITLYGPAPIRCDSEAHRRVTDLMSNFRHVLNKCMRDRARRYPVLKHFRVKVQS